MTQQYTERLQSFCEKRNLVLLSKEQFDKNGRQILPHFMSDLIGSIRLPVNEEIDNWLSTIKLPPNIVGLYGKLEVTNIGDVVVNHVFYLYPIANLDL